MNTLYLQNVSLVAVSSVKINETVRALQKSMEGIKYGEVLFFTHEALDIKHPGIRVIPIKKLGYSEYSHFIAYELDQYVQTDFALVVQHDGYVLHPDRWDPEFLAYDYIGAPWPPDIHFTNEGVNVRVGNGGFSLRSKKLLHALSNLDLPFTDNGTGFDHEDGVICVYHRKTLEASGIKFAPVDIAARFSHESDCDESVRAPFGFHGSKYVFPRFLQPLKKLLRKMHIRV